MIAVDTSALLAILLGEPDVASYEREIANADHCVTRQRKRAAPECRDLR